MEPEASKAAISAISALQERVRCLEEEQQKIIEEKSFYVGKINSRDERLKKKTIYLDEASQKAKDMLNYVTQCSHDLLCARDLNKRLKKSLQCSKTKLASIDPLEDHKMQEELRITRIKSNNEQRNASDYEILLSEFFSPISSSCSSVGHLSTYSDEDDKSKLPETLKNIIERMEKLPKDFKEQTDEDKQSTIELLTILHESSRNIDKQVRKLEYNEENEPKIKELAAQNLLISSEMDKFLF